MSLISLMGSGSARLGRRDDDPRMGSGLPASMKFIGATGAVDVRPFGWDHLPRARHLSTWRLHDPYRIVLNSLKTR
jgi:hypothetical protein